MYMIMTISGKPYIELEIDFMGKQSTGERQEHLEDIAAILHKEYFYQALGKPVSFYCSCSSRMDYITMTDFDMKEFDIKLKAIRFLKSKTDVGI